MNEELKDLIKAAKQPLSAFQIARAVKVTEKEIQLLTMEL
jgi:hypothetical protein